MMDVVKETTKKRLFELKDGELKELFIAFGWGLIGVGIASIVASPAAPLSLMVLGSAFLLYALLLQIVAGMKAGACFAAMSAIAIAVLYPFIGVSAVALLMNAVITMFLALVYKCVDHHYYRSDEGIGRYERLVKSDNQQPETVQNQTNQKKYSTFEINTNKNNKDGTSDDELQQNKRRHT